MKKNRLFRAEFLLLAIPLIAVLPGHADYVSTVAADKPAGYWRLGDNAPVPQPDVATNLGSLGVAANGEYLGKPATAQPGALVGSTDTATTFAGGQWLVVPYSTEINPNPPFTVECWVKPNSLQTGANVVSPLASLHRAAPAAEGWILYQSATGWNYRQGDSANNYTVNITGTDTIETNVWYHLVATYDGTTAILYTNGVEAARATSTSFVPNPSVNLGIGARGDNSFWFDGSVDEVAIYGTIISPTQVTAHYLNGKAAAPSPGYNQLVLADAPLGYWRLDEPQLPPLAVAVDTGSLGAAANGVYLNGAHGGQPGAIAGDADKAAGFDGVDDKIDISYNAGLNTPAYTIECWAKVLGGDGNYRSPLSARDDTPAGNPRGYIFYATPAGVWEFWTGQGSSWHTVGGPAVVNDTWAHLVGTFDGTNKLFYVNGELVGLATRETPSLSWTNSARPLRIGGGATEGAGNYFFNGDIDDVAVYNAALSADRIYTHYKTGSGAEPTPVLATIVADPQSQTNFLGQRVSFSVAALGSLPFQYKWKHGSADIPGAAGSTYTIEATKLTDSGDYTVEITNGAGSVTSAVATLTVLDISIPTIVRPPQDVTVYAGGTANFSVEATGSPNLTYQWQFKGEDLSGATNSTLAVTNAQTANQGSYSVKVTSAVGTTPSTSATLTVIVPPANSYAAIIMSDSPVAYWRLGETAGNLALDYAGGFNGTYLDGVTLGQPGTLKDDTNTAVGFNGADGKVEVPHATAVNGTRYSIECWAKVTGGAGNYRSPLTSRADSPQRGFIFYATPADQWEFWTGKGDQTGWDGIVGPAVVYDEWAYLVATYDGTTKRFYVNGREVGTSALAYAPNSDKPLRIGAGATDDPVGNFFFAGDVDEVAVYAAALSPERIALHYGAAFGASTPPSITLQPVPRAVLPGSDVSFTVGAAGSLPLKFQWQRNTVDIPNETNAVLSLTKVQAGAAGSYRAVASNLAGKATSDAAALTIVAVPELPYNQVIKGDGPVSYWRLDETSGETAADSAGANPGVYLNGVALGVPGALAGDPDLAAAFSAASQTKVEIPFSPDLNGPVFSVEVWAKVTGGAGVHRSPLTSRADLPQRGYIFYAEPGNTWQFWTGTGQSTGWDVIQGPAVRVGGWAYLAATYDGTTKRFFVDGVEVGSDTTPFGPNDEKVLRIGAGATDDPNGNFFFEGSVDEAAVYSKVLTPEQILVHYAVGAKPSSSPTLSIERSGSNVVLKWSDGVLLEAMAVAGASWQPVAGATSPYTLAPTGAAKFYQVSR